MRLAVAALAGLVLVAASLAWGYVARADDGGPGPASAVEPYPYGSPAFEALVEDSYRETPGPAGGARAFEGWLDQAYRRSGVRLVDGDEAPLATALDDERAALAGLQGSEVRTAEELRFLDREFWLVKKTLRTFTLDRGFEFRYAAERGERQCLLQSVLIAALAQRAGLPVGVAMVFRNPSGQESNLGHVVVLARLADGEDVLVDASDPEPFVRHQGLLLRRDGSYRCVRPHYESDSARIRDYGEEGDSGTEPPRRFQPLDYPYVRSQFFYYRGERVPGGLVNGPPTPAGLERTAAMLLRSTKICPANPLATYMLGRARRAQGRRGEARDLVARAVEEYRSYGWLPPGPRDALGELARRA